MQSFFNLCYDVKFISKSKHFFFFFFTYTIEASLVYFTGDTIAPPFYYRYSSGGARIENLGLDV